MMAAPCRSSKPFVEGFSDASFLGRHCWSETVMLAVIAKIRPLAAWLMVVLVTTAVTWLFYLLTSSIKANVAWLQGPIGKLSVKFGGPAALFIALLLLSRSYIPDQALVTLRGKV